MPPLPPALPLFLLTSLLSPLTSAAWTCPSTYSAGPCFTSAKNWTDAQRTCESHGSNLATVIDSSVNGLLGSGGCFSDAPWNDWECTWVGATDLRGEGTFEWASGAAFSYDEWGEYEPDATAGNAQDCAAVCKGGSVSGYFGNFWVDLDCDSQYAFCCDEATFSFNAGTAPADSFLHKLAAGPISPTPSPTPDPNPYVDRRLCFSTEQTFDDAQTLCKSIGSNLITIDSQAELNHISSTVHFSRVPDSWGLDWKCFWSGFTDRAQEGSYEWVSTDNPGFVPTFGPFEAGNGAGDLEDCVAVCQPDCGHLNSTESCVDLGDYGYTGTFLIDTKCSDAYAFCCDGVAAEYVAEENDRTPKKKEKNKMVIGLTVYSVIASVIAAVLGLALVKSKRDRGRFESRGTRLGGGIELKMLDADL
ncbi:hypothetical protein TL16_g10309 [Triparma laevis f. inornata]|uniref:C-type lectin domain-containing protein n=2 Tax=Triparma laevis TaxID=1534972 RepID=A0A9W7L004_9STRA|nr:hypothetical protein TL16_g10309 [Triparma laevis f. inornata]GMI18212.1 hypothetical protein TrLO_g15054 [Triparma laevis f. longispina]